VTTQNITVTVGKSITVHIRSSVNQREFEKGASFHQRLALFGSQTRVKRRLIAKNHRACFAEQRK
jgi:hypothetical protein